MSKKEPQVMIPLEEYNILKKVYDSKTKDFVLHKDWYENEFKFSKKFETVFKEKEIEFEKFCLQEVKKMDETLDKLKKDISTSEKELRQLQDKIDSSKARDRGMEININITDLNEKTNCFACRRFKWFKKYC